MTGEQYSEGGADTSGISVVQDELGSEWLLCLFLFLFEHPHRREERDSGALELQYSEQARATARIQQRIASGTRTNAITRADFLKLKDKTVGILNPLIVWYILQCTGTGMEKGKDRALEAQKTNGGNISAPF